MNNILRQGLEKGLPIVNLEENWDFLQVQCAMYINSDLPGLSAVYQLPGKPMRWVGAAQTVVALVTASQCLV